MALYHAGMSEYILGQTDLARTHLKQFLESLSRATTAGGATRSTCSRRRRRLPPVTAPGLPRPLSRPGCAAPRAATEIGRELGRGGYSVVYLARDRALDTDVALKLLVPPPAAAAGRARADAARGAGGPRALPRQHRRRLRLPRGRAVELHRHGVRRAGPTSQVRVGERGPLDADAAVRLGRDVAAALARRTVTASSTATSSRRTSCSIPTAARGSPTSAPPSSDGQLGVTGSGDPGRHAGLHGARGAGRSPRRRAGRPLRAGSHALLRAHRRSARADLTPSAAHARARGIPAAAPRAGRARVARRRGGPRDGRRGGGPVSDRRGAGRGPGPAGRCRGTAGGRGRCVRAVRGTGPARARPVSRVRRLDRGGRHAGVSPARAARVRPPLGRAPTRGRPARDGPGVSAGGRGRRTAGVPGAPRRRAAPGAGARAPRAGGAHRAGVARVGRAAGQGVAHRGRRADRRNRCGRRGDAVSAVDQPDHRIAGADRRQA